VEYWRVIDVPPIKHICLVGTNRPRFRLGFPHPEEPRSGVSNHEG